MEDIKAILSKTNEPRFVIWRGELLKDQQHAENRSTGSFLWVKITKTQIQTKKYKMHKHQYKHTNTNTNKNKQKHTNNQH